MTSLGRGFDAIADQYDEVRPDYPDELYDAIESVTLPWADADVLDIGAGTGIATRAILARGARVVALDPGASMLRRLRETSPRVETVNADAEQMPLQSNRFDLAVCATAWHWMDTGQTLGELRRVLRPGGYIALWWANNRWGQGVDWEDARAAVYERWQAKHGSRPWNYQGVAPLDAASDLRRRGLTVLLEREFLWTRDRTLAEHLRAIATHSDVIALGDRKQAFLEELAEALAPWPVLTERLWGPLVVARA
jgi:ubiquinone/menaquinone biosynthesis C-methylase UbiE